jgi:hypothetical protein
MIVDCGDDRSDMLNNNNRFLGGFVHLSIMKSRCSEERSMTFPWAYGVG